METATSTLQQPFGYGPRGSNPPHGAQQAQGPHSGPSAAPRPEERQQPHHKPFFYIQPSQPYLPMQNLQWPVPMPMPVSYNPYYGYPGLGYGMQMMPHYQPNPYVEPPSFVMPHTNLHLVDYRRILNPQHYQTMAYHSRRFRYQHNSQTRETTTSEVQTEPLSATQRTSTPGSNNAEAPGSNSVRRSHNNPSVLANRPLSAPLAVQKVDPPLEQKDAVPPSTTRTPPNSFVIQTEEVRIECCTTPAGLQLLHSHETAEVSHRFSQDVVQRGSAVQGRVLQEKAPDQSEQGLQACPDILLVSSSEKIPVLEEARRQTDAVAVPSDFASHVEGHGKCQDAGAERDLNVTSKNLQFKVVHLPFNPKYLDELRKMESTVWSMEDTLIPSPDSLSVRTDSLSETLVAEDPSDVLEVREEDAEEVVPMIEMPPPAKDDLEDMVPTLEIPGDVMESDADMFPRMDVPVAEEAPVVCKEEVAHVPYLLLLDNSPLKVDKSQHRRDDHQDTSFESLPAYLPSTSWLADFDNVYYCGKMPPTPKKHIRPLGNHSLDVPSRRRKLDLEYKDQSTTRKPKERYKPKGKVDRRSLSDHECCVSRNFNENSFTPYASKRERLCSRCLAKRKICTSTGPGLDGRTLKRKAAPFQPLNDALQPTCEACKAHSKNQLIRKESGQDARVLHAHDTEGESSENGSSRQKWRPADDLRKLNDLKRPLASKQNQEKCPAVMYPKLREKNCVCNEPQHQPAPWERLRHCPHGNTIREMDENCAVPLSPQDKWRSMNQTYLTHKWHTEKSWKGLLPYADVDGSKNDVRSQHLNKHKKSQPQSQEIRRKDTRC
ncbi:uncharacterized protein LOC117828805 [Notolabrus celidotus]|uniref:uncharacterized protein LOC117828805 n=1 Tax=Notolabrus celidotus TaxID=1203425 RepID=UPI00148F6A14|nr:uncharacterized protein LOC117828805 [Notolabrus celidotus]